MIKIGAEETQEELPESMRAGCQNRIERNCRQVCAIMELTLGEGRHEVKHTVVEASAAKRLASLLRAESVRL